MSDRSPQALMAAGQGMAKAFGLSDASKLPPSPETESLVYKFRDTRNPGSLGTLSAIVYKGPNNIVNQWTQTSGTLTFSAMSARGRAGIQLKLKPQVLIDQQGLKAVLDNR